MKLKIAVVGGTGPVGSALAKALARAGHDVTICSRDPQSERMREVLAEVSAGAPKSAAIDAAKPADGLVKSDVTVLCVPSPTSVEALHQLAKEHLDAGQHCKRRVIIDMMNALQPASGGLVNVLAPHNTSSAEELAKALAPSHHRIFKALNTVSAEVFGKVPVSFPKRFQPIDGYIAGEAADVEGLRMVEQIVTDAGFLPRLVGPLERARNLESLAEMYVNLKLATADGPLAFVLAHRGPLGGGSGQA